MPLQYFALDSSSRTYRDALFALMLANEKRWWMRLWLRLRHWWQGLRSCR